MLWTKMKLHAAAWLTAGLLVAATGFAAGRAGAFQDPGRGDGKNAKAKAHEKATPPGSGRQPDAGENLPLYVVKVDPIKAADLGIAPEEIRKAIADALEPPHPMSHPMVWIDPENKNRCFVRALTLDGIPVSIEKLLDLQVVLRWRGPPGGPPIRGCPLRNLVIVNRENRWRPEAELDACEQEFAAAEAELKQAEGRVRRARASLVAVRDRLKFALDDRAAPPAARPGRPAAKQ
ncbi:MAG: hypothetical protein ACYC61_10615 [Isosphaeraceae bacterium]